MHGNDLHPIRTAIDHSQIHVSGDTFDDDPRGGRRSFPQSINCSRNRGLIFRMAKDRPLIIPAPSLSTEGESIDSKLGRSSVVIGIGRLIHRESRRSSSHDVDRAVRINSRHSRLGRSKAQIAGARTFAYSQGVVRIAIGLTGRRGQPGDHLARPADRQIVRNKGHIIVGVAQRAADRIGADVFTSCPAQASRQRIATHQSSAGNLIGQRRIRCTIRLALGIRCQRDRRFTNRQ